MQNRVCGHCLLPPSSGNFLSQIIILDTVDPMKYRLQPQDQYQDEHIMAILHNQCEIMVIPPRMGTSLLVNLEQALCGFGLPPSLKPLTVVRGPNIAVVQFSSSDPTPTQK